MKRHVPILAVAATAVLLGLSLQAEAERPTPPEAPAPLPNDPSDEASPPPKPRRPEAPPRKPSPRDNAAPEKRAERPSPRRAATQKRPWMGIATEPVDISLREHLEIPEGFGIQIVGVRPGSPAAKAGLRAKDIVLRFEDQRLISPEHLSLLVRSKASGDKVPLALIRKGREETVDIVLGETDADTFDPWVRPGPPRQRFSNPPRPGEDMPAWQERVRRQQDDFLRHRQDWAERHRAQPKEREPKAPEARPALRRPSGRPPGLSVNPGFPLRVFGTEGILEIDNEQGSMTLTRKADAHHLVIEDAEGRVVYDGAFDPEKGVESLPEEARRQLEAMKLDNLEIRLPDPPAPTPEKTEQPTETEDLGEESIL